MPTPFVEVLAPEVPPNLVDLVGDRVLVGSAITCQVVVEHPEFAREHVLLAPRPDGCYVATARGAPTPVYVDAQPFDRGVVPWGREFSVGPVRFVLHDGRVPRAMYAARGIVGKGGDEKPAVNPLLLIVTLIVLPVAGYMLLSSPEVDIPRPTSAPPALFDTLERPCPQTDPQQVRVAASEAARQALARAERMPFRVQDGVAAVNEHALAAACYRAAGEVQLAEAQLTSARALSSRLEDSLLNHRFRLDRALEQRRVEDALVETRMLKNLLAHRAGHVYLNSLNNLERSLALQVDQLAAAAR